MWENSSLSKYRMSDVWILAATRRTIVTFAMISGFMIRFIPRMLGDLPCAIKGNYGDAKLSQNGIYSTVHENTE